MGFLKVTHTILDEILREKDVSEDILLHLIESQLPLE